ncbi:MAG: hypothetical protein ABJA78_01220 [Ferruginibacter sp.]
MNNRVFGTLNFYDLLKDYHRISADSTNAGRKLTEIYIPNHEEENKYCDTILASYTKEFPKVDFSFSKELDSIRGKKLFLVEMLFAEKFYKTYNKVIPPRNYKFELVENVVNNEDLLEDFFARVETNK